MTTASETVAIIPIVLARSSFGIWYPSYKIKETGESIKLILVKVIN